jgi:Icc protein
VISPKENKAYPKQQAEPSLNVIQITDTHLFADVDERMRGVDTFASLDWVLDSIDAAEQPDLVLATGDLAQDESEGAYSHFAAALERIAAPTLALAGNHDSHDAMSRAFTNGRVRLDKRFDTGNWRIIQLHSPVPHETFGELAETELERLDDALNVDKWALVCLHHPPVPVGSAWLDAIGLINSAQFFKVIDRHDNVRTVLAGHVHQDTHKRRGGIDYFTTPSTAVQFRPDMMQPAYDNAGPGYRRLRLFADGHVDTQVVRVDIG